MTPAGAARFAQPLSALAENEIKMRQYSKEFKSSTITKMLPPNNVPIPKIAQDTGVPKDTLYAWRLKHLRANGNTMAKQAPSGSLNSAEKFSIVMDVASLNEVELSEYCRHKGIYPEQVNAWREACSQANAPASSKVDRAKLTTQTKQIKQLEAELRRKDSALAETAALLVLQKKVQEIWGEPEGGK
jgi:transposase